jgi:hypothetical protein
MLVGKGGSRKGAGRKWKLEDRILPVSVGMTEKMYSSLITLAKKKKTTFQKMMRGICSRFVEENQLLEDKCIR